MENVAPGRPRKDGAPVNSKITTAKCERCQKTVRRGVMMRRHLLRCHPDDLKNHECSVCGSKFFSSDELLKHAAAHWRAGGGCPLSTESHCAAAFTRRAKMSSHLFEKHAEPETDILLHEIKTPKLVYGIGKKGRYACQLCRKVFSKPSQLERHLRIHTGEKPFACAYCGLRFNQKNSLVVHALTHTDTRPHKCPHCPVSFVQRGNLRTHIRNQHPIKPRPGRLACPHCSCVFRKPHSLRFHSMKFHQTLSEDQMMLSTINNVMEGLASLTERPNEKSDILQKALHGSGVSSQTVPTTDLRLQNKPLDDDQSDKNIIHDELSLEKILNSTSRLKKVWRHECEICKKSFKKSFDLARHIQTHSNVKPFQCDMCNRCFRLQSALSLHKHNIHHISINVPNTSNLEKTKKCQLIAQKDFNSLPIHSIHDSEDNLIISPQKNLENDDALVKNDHYLLQNPNDSFENSTLQYLENNGNILNINNEFICIDNVYLNGNNFTTTIESATANPQPSNIQLDNNHTIIMEQPQILEGQVYFTQSISLPDSQANMSNQLVDDTNGSNNIAYGIQVLAPSGNVKENLLKITENIQEIQHPVLNTDVTIEHTLFSLNSKSNFESSLDQTLDCNTTLKYPIENDEIKNSNNGGNENCIDSVVSRNLDLLLLKESLKINKSYKNPPLANCCEECPASFAKPSDLVRHKRVHTREKPFVCDTCGRGFAFKGSLKTHYNTHLLPVETKKETCQVCGKLFANKSSLRLHMRLHNGSKPYACSLCSSTFRTAGHRTAHLSSHFKSNEKKNAYKLLELCGDVYIPSCLTKTNVNFQLKEEIQQRTHPCACGDEAVKRLEVWTECENSKPTNI